MSEYFFPGLKDNGASILPYVTLFSGQDNVLSADITCFKFFQVLFLPPLAPECSKSPFLNMHVCAFGES